MFKIGRVPSLQAGPVEHADFLELECLRQSDHGASGGDLAAALGRVDDDLPEDRDDSDVQTENFVQETFGELGYRTTLRGRAHVYPFTVNGKNLFLEFTGTRNNWGLYLFLLFATRMNMRRSQGAGGDRRDGPVSRKSAARSQRTIGENGPTGWCSARRDGTASMR